MSSEKVIIGADYEHYKGKRYRLHGLAIHSETLEEMVYYECLYENPAGQMWVRPISLFAGQLEVNGKNVERFRKV